MAGAVSRGAGRSCVRAFLPATVHAVSIGEDLVFLDIPRDRYLCWPGASGAALDGSRTRLTGLDARARRALAEAGLIAPDPSIRRRLVLPRTPTADLFSPADRALGRADLMDAAAGWRDALVAYRRAAFADLLACAEARDPCARPDAAPSAAMADLVRRFHRWAPWTPAPAKCLVRSFLLLRLLRRHGFDARWVFAVRTWPFEAHCWLQAGPVVLDDAHERLVGFHPILAV